MKEAKQINQLKRNKPNTHKKRNAKQEYKA